MSRKQQHKYRKTNSNSHHQQHRLLSHSITITQPAPVYAVTNYQLNQIQQYHNICSQDTALQNTQLNVKEVTEDIFDMSNVRIFKEIKKK